MEKSNNNAKLVGALIVGAALGAALGILFAPNKGSETRKKLMSKGEDLTDDLKEKLNEFYERSKKEVEDLKTKV
ncbi:MAG: YtxH domain-containing protein [Crocinitomicaceae bacterium]|nr:MAG: YtxH domain-containing protein [Crocinitomicaceae bacterium]